MGILFSKLCSRGSMIPENIQQSLREFVSQNKRAELIPTYLYYLEQALNLQPVLFVKDKLVFRNADEAVSILGSEGKLWRETVIKIGYSQAAVNDQTTKIYICPFCGKVFGNNTCQNPQDAIYDWVAKCPQNTERSGGVRTKRFYISEDPKVIAEYAQKTETKEPIEKVVYSSVINGKLFHSKENVIEDFLTNYLKRISLVEVQGQSRFQIEEHFMHLIEEQLAEDKIAQFVEELSSLDGFSSCVERWLGEVEEEEA
jgi:hypothetical protein